MYRKRILMLLLGIFFMASPIYASIPDSIIIGNKAYDMRYVFNGLNSKEINDCVKNYTGKIYYRNNNETDGKIYKLPENVALTDDEESAIPQVTFKALDGNETLYRAGDGEAFDTATANVTIDTNTNSKKIQLLSSTVQGVSRYKIDGTSTVFDIGDSIDISMTDSSVDIDLLDSYNNILYKGTLNISKACTGKIFNVFTVASSDSFFIFSDSTKSTITGLTDQGKTQSNIVIPDSVTDIASNAFSGCTGLKSITLSDSATNISANAFNGCKFLTSITIPNTLINIDVTAFDGCPAMRVTCNRLQWEKFKDKFPTGSDEVTQDSWFTFSDASKTTLIGLTDEGKKHTNIVIPDKVTSIGIGAFKGCTGISSITIPNTVTRIDSDAFNGCTGISSIIIPNSVTSIGDSVFANCSRLVSITIPDSIINIGDNAFNSCPTMLVKCTEIQWEKFKDKFPVNSGQPSPDSWFVFSDSSKSAINGLSSEGEKHNSIIIPDSVTKIGVYAFYGCKGLTSVTIPDSVTVIGGGAFEECPALSSIVIPNSVTSVSQQAFCNCDALTSVAIPASVKSIENGSFAGCNLLISIKVNPNNLYYYDIDGVLYNKDKTSIIQYPAGKTGDSYTIPNTVTSIGADAFVSCSGLTSIIIPDSVTSIGYYAFSGCSGLTSINIPASVKSLKDSTFNNCTALTSIIIPNSVTNIGDSVFNNCIGLKSIAIPASVTSIGDGVFSECPALTSIKVDSNNLCFCDINGVLYDKDKTILIKHPGKMTDSVYVIPSSVTRIDEWAFEGCETLKSIIIPNSVVTIQDCAFSHCTGLLSITIPDSMTNIDTWVFGGCTGLKLITIPDSITSIDSLAFDACSAMTVICSQAQWDKFKGRFPYGSTRSNP